MKRKIVAAIIAVTALAAAGGYWQFEKSRAALAADPAASKSAVDFVTVRVASATIGTAVDRITLIGSVRAQHEADITPPEAGHIVALPFRDGSLVKEGDTLIALDSTIERAALADAEQQAQTRRKELERALELAGRGVSSQAQAEKARAELAAATAMLATSQTRVEHRTLSAPFAGQIGRLHYSSGAFVSPGNVVTTLRSVDIMEIAFSVPEARVEEVRIGMPFDAVITQGRGAAGTNIAVHGRISYVSPAVDAATRSVELVGEAPNPDEKMKPGMFVRVVLPLAVSENAVLVPENALIYALAGEFVFRVRDGRADRVPVSIGITDKGMAQISGDIAAGDQVITDGRFAVRHGGAVKIAAAAGRSQETR